MLGEPVQQADELPRMPEVGHDRWEAHGAKQKNGDDRAPWSKREHRKRTGGARDGPQVQPGR